MSISFDENELPEVILDSAEGDEYTYVKVGTWTFCVEDDLEYEDWWESAKSLIAYARYLDEYKAKREV